MDSASTSKGEIRSPSSFLRELRPEYYSDTEDRITYALDRGQFEYHLETLTNRNQTQAFEIFCRKLCERAICPNLRGQTGPDGGGDSKADAESFPVATEISALYFEGDANAASERWAFAFSAKENGNRKFAMMCEESSKQDENMPVSYASRADSRNQRPARLSRTS
jgi:hypothetical protein